MQANQFDTGPEDGLNSSASTAGRFTSSRAGWAILALVLIAVLLRIIGLPSREVHPDEWYHLLAGTSWANGDGLTFVRGIYDRAWPFTVSTGLVQNWFGLDGFIAARFPAMISGVFCVWLLYVLGKRSVSSTVGLIAAALLTFDAMAIEWSQLARFYTMQTACVLAIACILVGPVLPSQGASIRRMVLSLVAVAILAVLSLLLQIISIAAVAGLAAFFFTQTRFFTAEFAKTPSWQRNLVGLGLVAAAIVGMVGIYLMWPDLRATQAWTAADKDNILYYDDFLRAMYGVLWPLTPLAVLIGLSHSRRGVLVALSVVLPVLVLQSLGGMKAPRYIIQAMPFLFLLWAIGLRSGFLWLAGMIRDRVPFGDFGPGKTTSYVAALAVLAFALAGNLSFRNTAKWTIQDGRAALASGSVLTGNPVREDLDGSLTTLKPLLREDTTLMTTDPQILAHYGMVSQLDIANPRNDDGVLFTYSRKSGQVELALAEELEVALNCLPAADIVLLEERVGTFLVPDDTQAVIDGRTVRMATDAAAIRLYQWTNSNTPIESDCADFMEAISYQR